MGSRDKLLRAVLPAVIANPQLNIDYSSMEHALLQKDGVRTAQSCKIHDLLALLIAHYVFVFQAKYDSGVPSEFASRIYITDLADRL